MSNRKRYVQIGCGGRGRMFTRAVCETYKDQCELVGLCDKNPTRLDAFRQKAKEFGSDVPGYSHTEYEKMITEQKPDVVIVTTMDSTHDEYICKAMEMGCDVITEKPMTIDADRCNRILNTAGKTGRNVRVTFNYRYSPPRSQVKELLMEGAIGQVVSVDFKWLLDLRHGADYFRRWHRNKENSGGLLVHKSTHHFDLVNWWISDLPKEVAAFGGRKFYVPDQAEAYGLHARGARCSDCSITKDCKFYLDLNGLTRLQTLYKNAEKHDGYFRDKCVFSEDIDIEDNMQVIVKYHSGVGLTYSLNAFMPWEGYEVIFNGTKGRLVHACQETSYVSGDGSVQGGLIPDGTTIQLQPCHAEGAIKIPVRKAEGGHGGGDAPLLDDLFNPNAPTDPLNRAADHYAGAASIITGVAANQSIASGNIVKIADLVADLGDPKYPAMPTERIPQDLQLAAT